MAAVSVMDEPAMSSPVSGQAPRVLVVHNQYQQRGGEDSVVEAEVALLRAHGHEVHEYRRTNHDISGEGRASVAAQTIWSQRTDREVSDLIARVRPDVMHVHNTFPLISPSVYWASRRAGVPIVQTLHNFRLICPQALLLRDGKVCEDCVGRLPWRGVVHGCYRESRLQTAVLTGMLGVHRAIGTWQRGITRYIALNDFCRRKFIEGGLPSDRIDIKPNFVDLPPPAESHRQGFLFVGRLSQEKGINVLAAAAARFAEAEISVAGGGPEQHMLDGIANIIQLGPQGPEAVYAAMQKATALVLPSIWYENFPRTLVEAFACGLPVIASRIGALGELVKDGVTGLLFEPGNGHDLAERLRWAQAHPHEMAVMGRAARHAYESELSAPANYQILIDIYQRAQLQFQKERG